MGSLSAYSLHSERHRNIKTLFEQERENKRHGRGWLPKPALLKTVVSENHLTSLGQWTYIFKKTRTAHPELKATFYLWCRKNHHPLFV